MLLQRVTEKNPTVRGTWERGAAATIRAHPLHLSRIEPAKAPCDLSPTCGGGGEAV
jgi:hypothetical protein